MPRGVYDRKNWHGNSTSFKKGRSNPNKGKRKYKPNCLTCNVLIDTDQWSQKFCSHSCFMKYRHKQENIKKNNGIYKGKQTPFNKQIRALKEMDLWRSKIFERDNWTCQTCSCRGCYLEAHHIVEFNVIMKENKIETIEDALKCKDLWNIDNGVTLCKECHNLTKRMRYQ